MRKPKIKFPLILKDDCEARTMEELREYFDLEKIIGYFQDGRLVTWLSARHYADEAESIEKISKASSRIGEELCGILGVEFTGKVDVEDIAWHMERLERLKQYTANPEILSNVDVVAFDQDDLEGIIEEEDTDVIYLCGAKFILNSGLLRKHNVRYVGILKNTKIVIDCKESVDFQESSFFFENIEIDEKDRPKLTDGIAPSNINRNHKVNNQQESMEICAKCESEDDLFSKLDEEFEDCMPSDYSEFENDGTGRIMLVDDAAFMRKLLREILKKKGYEVIGEAENGKVAIKKYLEIKPYVVIMDIMMPEMDGITATKYIRRLNPGAKIIVSSLPSSDAVDEVVEAIQSGAIDYILKPFVDDRVFETVAKVIELGDDAEYCP